jgi:MoxR-like ATPase
MTTEDQDDPFSADPPVPQKPLPHASEQPTLEATPQPLVPENPLPQAAEPEAAPEGAASAPAAAQPAAQASPQPAAQQGNAAPITSDMSPQEWEGKVKKFREQFNSLVAGVQQAMVGQNEVIEGTLIAMISGGHVLLEGVPGLGKTFLVRTLSQVLNMEFNRIQFTPDLMPADIMGTNLVIESPDGGKEFKFQQGPIFTSLCLADEINRATPKTQSALLEAMQEKSVTTAGAIRPLPRPFFVLATQNPLEMEGTYPLPEAQLDRFFFKIDVSYPSLQDLMTIVERTTATKELNADSVMDRDAFLELQSLVTHVPVAEHVLSYAMRLVLATQPTTEHSPEKVRQYVNYGSSPRGAQAIIKAAKAKALLQGRLNVAFEDVAWAALPALRHRIILNFEGEAEGISTDDLVADILNHVLRDAALAASL